MLKKNEAAFFLDRDGVIIKNVPYLNDIKKVEFIPGVEKAIRKINDLSYKCIVITNQSGVARGLVSLNQLAAIHEYIWNTLARAGARVDAFYYCPHHPEGKVSEYAIRCHCRKPGIGMLIRAAKDFNLDLSKCIMIGDQKIDIITGETAGCESFLVSDEAAHESESKSLDTLEKVVNHVVNRRKGLV